jgi:hypothetical protein
MRARGCTRTVLGLSSPGLSSPALVGVPDGWRPEIAEASLAPLLGRLALILGHAALRSSSQVRRDLTLSLAPAPPAAAAAEHAGQRLPLHVLDDLTRPGVICHEPCKPPRHCLLLPALPWALSFTYALQVVPIQRWGGTSYGSSWPWCRPGHIGRSACPRPALPRHKT